jgi:hypothetical protein
MDIRKLGFLEQILQQGPENMSLRGSTYHEKYPNNNEKNKLETISKMNICGTNLKIKQSKK